MPTIGKLVVNLHVVDRDETVYVTDANTVSHVDKVALRRTEAKTPAQPLRTQVRFERGFPAPSASGTVEKSVTVSIAVSVPPGITPNDVKTYVKTSLLEAADLSGQLAVTGDIHL